MPKIKIKTGKEVPAAEPTPEHFGVGCKYAGWTSQAFRVSFFREPETPGELLLEFTPEKNNSTLFIEGLRVIEFASANSKTIFISSCEVLHHLKHFIKDLDDILIDLDRPAIVSDEYHSLKKVAVPPEYGEYQFIEFTYCDNMVVIFFRRTTSDGTFSNFYWEIHLSFQVVHKVLQKFEEEDEFSIEFLQFKEGQEKLDLLYKKNEDLLLKAEQVFAETEEVLKKAKKMIEKD